MTVHQLKVDENYVSVTNKTRRNCEINIAQYEFHRLLHVISRTVNGDFLPSACCHVVWLTFGSQNSLEFCGLNSPGS